MQNFKNCKAIYRRISKGEKLGRKIKYRGGQYEIGYQDFEGRTIIYEGLRRQDRRLYIHHIDRTRDRKEVLTVSLNFIPKKKPIRKSLLSDTDQILYLIRKQMSSRNQMMLYRHLMTMKIGSTMLFVSMFGNFEIKKISPRTRKNQIIILDEFQKSNDNKKLQDNGKGTKDKRKKKTRKPISNSGKSIREIMHNVRKTK